MPFVPGVEDWAQISIRKYPFVLLEGLSEVCRSSTRSLGENKIARKKKKEKKKEIHAQQVEKKKK